MIIRQMIIGLSALVITSAVYAETGIYPDRIVVGQSAALTGPAGKLGSNVRAGAMAYFDAINKSGGIYGRKIDLISLDDRYESLLAETNTQQLIKQYGVFALFGYVGTPTSLAAQSQVEANNTLFFAPITGAEALRKPFNRNVFNIRASYFDETDNMIKFLGKNRANSVAVIYQNDSYGETGLDGIQRSMKKLGCVPECKPIVTASIDRNSLDATNAINKIEPLHPNVVIIVSAYSTSAQISRMLDKKLPGTQKMNLSFVGTDELLSELGEEAYGTIISQVVPYPYSSVEPFIKEYKKAMAGKVSYSSFEGYINAAIFVEGLRRAGPDLNRNRFIKALESAGKIDLQGFKVIFSPDNHNGSTFVETTMLTKSGKVTH